MAITFKEQAQKLYEEFATIFHPLYWDFTAPRCKQSKECAIKAATLLRDNCQADLWSYWNGVIEEIEKIKMPKEEKINTQECNGTNSNGKHAFSKAMHQEYPRRCIFCHEQEKIDV